MNASRLLFITLRSLRLKSLSGAVQGTFSFVQALLFSFKSFLVKEKARIRLRQLLIAN